jgi:glutamine cyclotransferase
MTLNSSAAAATLAIASWFAAPAPAPPAQTATTQSYRVVNVYPHDAEAFTQGLIFRDGFLFESTGQYGRSTLRKVELKTGRVVQQHRLDPVYFGEGLAEWNGQLVQLTWRSQIAFVYDLVSFKPLRTFGYSAEGWGLTHNQREFILSDGTNTWIDLSGLMSSAYRLEPEAVLNGIAYDALNNRLFVTGKLWPRLFEIQVVPRS